MSERTSLPVSGRLDCDSCGTQSTGRTHDWRAFLGIEDDDDSTTVVVLCPTCAEEVDHA